jgi:hypothetical protein
MPGYTRETGWQLVDGSGSNSRPALLSQTSQTRRRCTALVRSPTLTTTDSEVRSLSPIVGRYSTGRCAAVSRGGSRQLHGGRAPRGRRSTHERRNWFAGRLRLDSNPLFSPWPYRYVHRLRRMPAKSSTSTSARETADTSAGSKTLGDLRGWPSTHRGLRWSRRSSLL